MMIKAAQDGRPATGAEQTRLALIRAGLSHFGRFGFEGATTRDIAAEAGANIGSIAYHFGGKEGLLLACARHLVDTLRELAGPALAAAADPSTLTPDSALAVLETVLRRMTNFIVARPEAGEFVTFVLRELNRPTIAFDTVYSGAFEPVHVRLCALWAAATGDQPDSEAAKLGVFTMIGQVVYFRIGREAVLRRMDWPSIGDSEAGRIADVALGNLRSMVAARREGRL